LLPRYFRLGLIYILLIALAFLFIFPFYDMLIGSFMDDSDLFSKNPSFWPKEGFDLAGYIELLTRYNFARPLFNSFLMATVRTVGTLFFCSLAGFAFAKRQFPGRDALFFAMLATMILPTQITLIPWYLLMVKTLGWSDTFWPFWIPLWATAFGIFLMRQFISSTIPDEVLEASYIDGASVFGSFIRIVLPVMGPALAVLGILAFVESWNDFLGPMLLLHKPEMMTAPLALVAFQGSSRVAPKYSMLFAGSVLSTLPLIILFFLFQRRLIAGIMSGAIKGGG
jgi:ABC-type glycerol-3-phosphate transport system permease component